jgi:hypothetical protein
MVFDRRHWSRERISGRECGANATSGSANYPLLANGEEFAFLRSDPRFQALLKKTNASYELLKQEWK